MKKGAAGVPASRADEEMAAGFTPVGNASGTTWEVLVLGERDACLLCGALISGPRKTLEAAAVDAVLLKLEAPGMAGDSVFVRALRNIYECALAAEDAGYCYVENFFACACCHYWFARRAERSVPLTPLLTMHWHLRVISVECKTGQRSFDVRVMQRLCRALVARPDGLVNYYWTLLSPAEQEVVAAVAQCPVEDVCKVHARWFHAQNGFSPFLHSARVAEMVRASV